ncbi:MAG: RNA polymerase sigma factor [Planctomycetota bacterium]|jgi:RNA polymerase sigma factor (sigma-70 family)
MTNNNELARLVKKARLGDRESLNCLAEAARVRLREYVFRLTLQEDLTQDINKLKRTDRFWSWLHGIAFNKVRGHYGRRWRHRKTSLSELDCEIPSRDSHDGLAGMINRELKQVVIRSMQELSPRHRAVLTMRCYEQMPYSKIAEAMGCTEFGAQALFYRAKKSLAKKLSRHGLGKQYLLAALILFGKMTAATEATAVGVSVTAATIKVGAVASLAAMAMSKTAVVSLATAGLLAGGVVATKLDGTGKEMQGSGAQPSFDSGSSAIAGSGAEQCWYFFPGGAGKGVITRLLRSDVSGKRPYCQLLQNQHANYYNDKGKIFINNYRMYNPDLSVRRLPTDGKNLTRFISQVEGKYPDMEYVSGRPKGLLVISKRSGTDGNKIWRIDRHDNVLEEEYFQADWPASATVIDNRDTMHERGWTYFRISGRIHGEQVSGTGRMPFVYATSKQFHPWLELRLADGSKIIDSGADACVLGGNGELAARYEGGSFFKGLGRPWMGLHTIDTVRRDAAEQEVPFETKDMLGDSRAEVVLTYGQLKLIYTVHMETDVIEKIAFTATDGAGGELTFSYLQEVDDVGDEFMPPTVRGNRGPRRPSPGMLWLVNLMTNRWYTLQGSKLPRVRL